MITNIDTKNGLIWYEYKSDEIAWDGKKYLSLLCDGAFDTLEEVDEFWEEYWKVIFKKASWRVGE